MCDISAGRHGSPKCWIFEVLDTWDTPPPSMNLNTETVTDDYDFELYTYQTESFFSQLFGDISFTILAREMRHIIETPPPGYALDGQTRSFLRDAMIYLNDLAAIQLFLAHASSRNSYALYVEYSSFFSIKQILYDAMKGLYPYLIDIGKECYNVHNQSDVGFPSFIPAITTIHSNWMLERQQYVFFEAIFSEFRVYESLLLKLEVKRKHWNKRFGSMLSLKGRYLNGLKEFEHLLNAFGGQEVNKTLQNKIIASLYPLDCSELYLMHFTLLIRLRRFETALDQYTFLKNNKVLDKKNIIWFGALKIKLFAELSQLDIQKSKKYIKKAFKHYNKILDDKYNDEKHEALFGMHYGFLLMVSGDKQRAMNLLERLSVISKTERGYIEYMNGYLQHYHFQNYAHAKHHYFSSFLHNTQIPEVRYHLCVLLIQCKEYKMAYVQLKQGINMQSGFPYLQGNCVDSLLKILRKKLKRLKCSNCGRNYYSKRNNQQTKTLAVCKGCGKTYYCNRKCQKRDWKYSHRLQCNKTYQRILKMFKLNAPFKSEFCP